ncbi:EKC/KEOPS complex subunit LAGE3-like [Pteropus medius]|uniref:EKC/KEOPS complex subunit LAGE3-like n=1 Tax=Pteropus vampyrus TaxID=132908 RepID=UPI00196B8F8D|nr:EKC/KEOPS complex subunit LAGE3-like [Pteropus giganteus]
MASEANREVEAAIQAMQGVWGEAGAGDVLEGPEYQGGPGGPDCQIEPDSTQGQDRPGGPSSHCAPGSPDGQGGACARGNEGGPVFPDDQRVLGAHDGQGGAGARDDPRGPDAQYEQAGHRGLGGPGVEERVGSAAVGADNVARAACASGSDGDAARDDVGPENRPLVFTITVPFGSHLVAEMARRAMDVESLHHHQSVQKDFRVYGSILAVRWIADEPGPLQESVNSFFQLLSLLL